ncbi:virulence factor [Parazoarcus communis]|uniref:Virulence factor n=1 Tax=Parazoarcus communis TaxID=41977 RepID=A0A2U8H7W8_9RHOO|nr:virulence factor [Parazoarcus communis]
MATRPRRIGLTLLLFLLAIVLSSTLGWLAGTSYINVSEEYLMARTLGLPALAAAAFFMLSSVLAIRSVEAAAPVVERGAHRPGAPFVAQVVGVQWLNPLIRRDYPTEWQLLWTLGLAKPNEGDLQVRNKPGKFLSVQPVASIVSSWNGRATFSRFFAGYVREVLRPIGRRYAMNRGYFYTVQPESQKDWRELAGIHVEFAIPATDKLDPLEATRIIRERISDQFGIGGDPVISSRDTPPDVRITTGGASAGFTSLGAALDYLEAHPTETVWAMNWDAPDFPLDEQMSENCVLLVLAGPAFETGRDPLAWVGRPAVRHASEFDERPGESRAVQAWRSALDAAASGVARPVNEIAYVIHDAGKGNDVAGDRLSLLGHALAEPLPELDIITDAFNMPALVGNMGAGSALTNVALAVSYAHYKGRMVLVAGTTEPGTATAVAVTPPAHPRTVDSEKPWFRARGEGNVFLPWWGLRYEDRTRYMQGYSE